MKNRLCFRLVGAVLVLVFVFAETGTADDAPPVDKIVRVSDLAKTCDGTLVGSRWCNQENGTIKDLNTGLVWSQRADCWDRLRWNEILPIPFKKLRHGICGLADGSLWGDWRAPTRKELAALTSGPDAIRYRSPGPFTGIQSVYYWTATTKADNRQHAWSVNMLSGTVVSSPKHMMYYLWSVRNAH
ncbi:MAG: DUF1566 domain-containing protein [Desulfobacterales bacterium]|nr:DUF1566 domain-containing protein [Desulfobacterales bacterium]